MIKATSRNRSESGLVCMARSLVLVIYVGECFPVILTAPPPSDMEAE